MRNLWVAGRALTSACTYLAHMKPALDGSPPPPAGGCGRGPGPAQRVAVPAVPGRGHRVQSTRPRTCPPLPGCQSRPRSAPRVPAARRGAGPGTAARRRPPCGPGTPRAPPRAAAAPPAAPNNARPPRHSPLTWPCRLPAGAPTARGIVGSRLRDARHGNGNWPGRVTGAWRAPRLVGQRRETGACRRAASYRRAPVSAAARPLPRAGPARKARGRAELPRAAPAPARPSVRPLARSPGPAPPLTAAPAPRAQRPAREARKVRRKVRVSGRACRGRSAAPPGTWRAKGGKEGARVLVGDFPPAISTPQFGSSPGKRIVSQAQTQATFPSNQ